MTLMAPPLESLTLPTPLKTGDKIGIVSTARKISAEELQYAIDILNEWGLVPVLGEYIFAHENQYAGSDHIRAYDFQNMLDNPEVKAILCARGGYGTVRIIDRLDFQSFVKHPKWIVGFSDITVLHSHLNRLNICSIHSTMPISFANNSSESLNSLKNALFGNKSDIIINKHPLNTKGQCNGQIVGGNLSVLYSLIGSRSDIDTTNKILFLEDLDEYLYHVDRMMMSLKRSGKLSSLAGLIVGGMTKMNDNAVPFGKTAETIIKDCVSEYNIPVCFHFPAGHIKHNLALQLGRQVSLEVGEMVSLRYE